MHQYRATVRWQHTSGHFSKEQYSRNHSWHFDGGLEIPASASPKIVPEPYSEPSAVDPEEAFVASIASCHMLWFLSLAAKEGFTITSYEDVAEGIMRENDDRKLAITEVILKPMVRFKLNSIPSRQIFDALHEQAHENCFIARSVNAEIVIDAQFSAA